MDVDPISDQELLSSPPVSAAPTITGFNMFQSTTPTAPLKSSSPGAGQPRKRRSLSSEGVSHVEQDAPSSPPPSSPSEHRLERMGNTPLLSHFSKPGLQGIGLPSNANKRPRRPAFSAIVHPADSGARSAYPAMESGETPSHSPAASRRVVSAQGFHPTVSTCPMILMVRTCLHLLKRTSSVTRPRPSTVVTGQKTLCLSPVPAP